MHMIPDGYLFDAFPPLEPAGSKNASLPATIGCEDGGS